MTANLAALAYLVAGVLFILALRGFVSPSTSPRSARIGMISMAIAIVTTLAHARPVGVSAWLLVVIGMGIGGAFGALLARRIELTKAPQLVAFFQSLVGLAAVLVAAGALFAPQAFGVGAPGAIHGASLVEMSLGATLGAIAFAGSVIACARLERRMSDAPILLPRRRLLAIALAAALLLLIAIFVKTQSHAVFFLIALAALAIGVALLIPIGGADMPIALAALNSCSGWAAASLGFMLGNLALIIAGAVVGSSCAMLSWGMCKKDWSATP